MTDQNEKVQLLIGKILEAAGGDYSAFFPVVSPNSQNDEIGAIGVAYNSLLEEFRSATGRREQDIIGWRRALHDIRGPIGSVKNLIDMLRSSLETGAFDQQEAARIFEAIHASTDLMLRKIDLAIGAQRNSVPRITRIDFAQLVDEAREFLLLPEETTGFRVTLDVAPDFTLYSDRELLLSVVRNLIENAHKYRRDPQGGLLQISAFCKGDEAILKFADDGLGIPGENIQNIFQLYSRFSEKPDGHGYGLYSVKRDVESLHGEIEVESESGKGTSMVLRFQTLYPDSVMGQMSNVRQTPSY